jgi:DNA-binding response OmpR family regulator
MIATGEPPRVLVANDEPSIVDIVGSALRHHGFDVAAATTGGEAAHQAIAWRPHAISLEEVVARVRNILRRRGLDGGSRALRVADLELDEQTREVTRDGRSISLTGNEFRLLRELMLNPRRVLTRPQLLERAWGYDFGSDARVLETYVSYLRKKLDGRGPPLVQTVRVLVTCCARPAAETSQQSLSLYTPGSYPPDPQYAS